MTPQGAWCACPDYSCGLLAIEQGWVLIMLLIVATGLPTTGFVQTRKKADPERSTRFKPTCIIPAGALSCSGASGDCRKL